MRHRILTRLVVGLALTAAVASVNCGGDDTTPGGTGSGGTGGGSGGATGTGGTGGAGGTGGTGTGGTGGVGTGGTADSGSGGGGTGGVRDAGPDGDAAAAGTFAAVQAILQQRCQGCHNPTLVLPVGVSRIDLTNTADDAGRSLYARLTSPLPVNQEGTCGFTLGQEAGGGDAEAGADAGDGGDGGGVVDAAVRPNRIAIVPNNLALSYLYQKINGGFEAQNVQPPVIGCGARMPRIFPPVSDAGAVDGGDGGDAAPPAPVSVACDLIAGDGSTAACLSPALIASVAAWITAGAPQ